MLNLLVLLYEDDTVIMAENECAMQRNLYLLNEYCNCNGLTVNIRKTKIMVFARSRTRLRNLPTFKFGNLDLDLVDDYWVFVLIGMAHSLKQKNSFMIKHRRPCTHTIQKGRRLKLPTDIMLKLFDSCVAPISLYGCEVWGYENTDIIEKVHTKFCKFHLWCIKIFS